MLAIMRMDADSCFLNDTDVDDAMPRLRSNDEVYRANQIAYEHTRYADGLWEFTEQYAKENNLTPRNMDLWSTAKKAVKYRRLPSFANNFEVSKVEFFTREDVMMYQIAVAEQEPFGIFRKRWGDAPIRLLTLALFASPSEIDMIVPSSYAHDKDHCPGLKSDTGMLAGSES